MKTNWRAVLGAVLLMLAGGALALASEHALILHHRGRPASSAPSHDVILKALDNHLKLTATQHDSIDAILTRHQADIDSAWKQIHSVLRVSMDSVHKEIGRVLTAQQTQEFHRWLRGQRLHMGR